MKYTIEIEVNTEERKLRVTQGEADPNAIVAFSFEQTIAILQSSYDAARKDGAKVKDMAPLLRTIHHLNKWADFYDNAAMEEAEKREGILPTEHEEAGPFPDVAPLMKVLKDTDIN